MGLVREMGITVAACDTLVVATCSDLLSTAGSTTPVPNKLHATADAVITACAETTVFGDLIDRLGPVLGRLYSVAMPSARVYASRGDTGADRKWTLGIRLQHGDSSGGGDFADYSTQNAAQTIQYFSTARTSDMANWDTQLSTGPLNMRTNPCYYDLRAAKRYLRVAVPVLKNNVSTGSADEAARLNAEITFLVARGTAPVRGHASDSPFSSSTTT